MPEADEVGGVGGSISWDMGAPCSLQLSGSLKACTPALGPVIASVLIPWVLLSVLQDRGVGSTPDYFKGFHQLML